MTISFRATILCAGFVVAIGTAASAGAHDLRHQPSPGYRPGPQRPPGPPGPPRGGFRRPPPPRWHNYNSYYYQTPVYAPPPVVYTPPPSVGINLVIPFHF